MYDNSISLGVSKGITMHYPNKIISGGQTGVDIGALVGAKKLGIETGGEATKGYLTEAGPQVNILRGFGLRENDSSKYPVRTRSNISKADATIILATNKSSAGTRLATSICNELAKPYLVIDPFSDCIRAAREFVVEHKPSVLNIAGNRESSSPGIAARTAFIIVTLFSTQ